jgi:hypothetical protein
MYQDCYLYRLQKYLKRKLQEKRRCGERKWLARRSTHIGSVLLLKELYAEVLAGYRACLRLSPECFDTLHDLIAIAIQRSDTLMRDVIPSRIKLEVTLSFLATGNSYR